MIDEGEFKQLLLRIVEMYSISPETADALLLRILAVLALKSDECKNI